MPTQFWMLHWHKCWQPMAFMLLPLGIVLATSLVTQLEFKNNTWKQLHASPLSFTTIFFSKFAVLLVMMVQLFSLFNAFAYLTALDPAFWFSVIPFHQATSFNQIAQYNALIFLDCLPILSLQYLLSLQFKNFMVPVGAGMVIWLLGTIGLSWQYSFIFPYLYSAFEQIMAQGGKMDESAPNIHLLASGYFFDNACCLCLVHAKSRQG